MAFVSGFRDGARDPEFGRRRDGMWKRTSTGIPRHAEVKGSYRLLNGRSVALAALGQEERTVARLICAAQQFVLWF
jgi:hypothetical protein